MEFAKLNVWPLQIRRQTVPDPEAGSGESPVTKTGTGPRDDACVHVVPLLSVTHGQCDARCTVTFPACTGTYHQIYTAW